MHRCGVSSPFVQYARFILLSFLLSGSVFGQSQQLGTELILRGDRLSGVVLPVLPRATGIAIHGLRANAWSVDDTKRLLVEQNVRITIGAYTFESEQAVVWLNRMDTDAGVVSQIAVFLPTFAKSSNHAAIGAEGENLLVVGSTLGTVTLDVALLDPKKPSTHAALLQRAKTRLAGYLYALANFPPQLSTQPRVITAPNEEQDALAKATLLDEEDRGWLRPKSGFVSVAADFVEFLPEEIENAVTLAGNVRLAVRSTAGVDDMDMSATRGVIFLDPGSVRDIASGRVDISEIRGVYLEGNVVITSNDGKYLVRAPQMYYDFETGKAIMLEAVLRTYIKSGRVPLFIRADELRQISTNEWIAEGVQASTSAFTTPDLAIGATKMTISQNEHGDAYVKSENNTLRIGGVPVMYWPNYEGVAGEIPLRRIKLGYEKNFGTILESGWDLFALLGIPTPGGVEADLKINDYKKRGFGVGLDFTYSFSDSNGLFTGYLQKDSGTQRTVSGIEIPVTESSRGYVLWTNETELNTYWTLQTQLSYISDPTFMSVWRQNDYQNHLEYETSMYAKYQHENLAFTALASSDVNQFISTSWLLASRQFKVDKLPELSLVRYGEKIFNDTVTWSSETKIMRERMVFQSGTPNQLGLVPSAFGLPNGNTPISAPLTAAGLQQEYQNRLFTRQEFSMPFKLGDVKFVPSASIQSQWGIDNTDDERARETNFWFRTFGITASTQFNRIYNSVDNDILDLHRLRHVIEPYITVWNGDSNIDVTTIPQYDASIDNLSTGTMTWVGVRNILQTWRGGPGRWYQVDWLSLDTAFLFANDGAVQRYDHPQFISWRPEYSSIVDAAVVNGKWQLSDGVAFTGHGTWDLDGGTMSRGSLGAELDHGRDVRTYIEYREIDNTDDQFLSLGVQYALSKRYSLNFAPSWNFAIDALQSYGFTVTRHYPEFDLIAVVNYDKIQEDTTYGFRFNLIKF
jgi:hypothetical protein